MKTTHASLLLLALIACTSRNEPTASSAASTSSGLGRSATADAQGAATPSKPAQPTPEIVLQTSLDFYDGADKRTVWLSNELVAEFAPSEAGKDVVLRGDAQAAEVPQPQKSVRLWRVKAPRGTDAFAREASSAALRLSPVLHDSPSAGLPMRALPGGVVTTFPKDWDRARIDAWLAARKLSIESDVVAAANMFLIATPPGLEAIRIANELYATHELVGATPNFWMQMSAR